MPATLEHLNITVPDPDVTAAWLCDVFDWQIRWQGAAIHNGRSIHVGGADSYLAIYTPTETPAAAGDSYRTVAGLNHVGIVVADIDATEARVQAQGFTPHSHADYDPGRRFYFNDPNGIEFEVVQY